MIRTTIALTLCLVVLAVPTQAATTLPTLPQAQVNTALPAVTGSTLNATCATLQAQINAAAALPVNLTHEIILATGTTCTGPYKLASHTGGTGWILIKGANHASLPAPGTRVSLTAAAQMPRIKYGDDNIAHVGAFSALTGAQRYRIIGVEMIQDSALDPNWAMVATGRFDVGVTNTGYIILDRVVMHDTDPAHRFVRAVLGEAEVGHVALIDSYVAGFRHSDTDTQAFLSISNPGPILVSNNFLEASGENVMFCGGTPVSEALMPRDITIKGNTFSKNAAWFGLSSGTLVKTLIELKCGVRVLIEANDFLNMPGNDAGNFFRFTVRNETGGSPYAEVSDVTFRHNLVANVCNGVNMFGADDQGNGMPSRPSKHVKRVSFTNNLFYGLGANCVGQQGGRFFAIVDGASGTNCTDPNPTCKTEDLTVSHNTVDDVGDLLFCVTTNGFINLDWKDNLINGNSGRGIFDCGGATSSSYGSTRLTQAWGATWNWDYNHIALSGTSGEDSAQNPQAMNAYPTNASTFMWTNRAARDYTLAAGSPAKNTASDGTDRGVNFVTYNAARAGNVPADTQAPAVPTNLMVQ